MLPFRMLRCYVTSLRGGVQYQAAGEFEQPLDWKPLLADSAAQDDDDRLIATLEAFLRHASTDRPRRGIRPSADVGPRRGATRGAR